MGQGLEIATPDDSVGLDQPGDEWVWVLVFLLANEAVVSFLLK